MGQDKLTMSGRNDVRETRTVYLSDVEIGKVVPYISSTLDPLWCAVGLDGREHGRWWTKDWYAADALTRIPCEPERVGLAPIDRGYSI